MSHMAGKQNKKKISYTKYRFEDIKVVSTRAKMSHIVFHSSLSFLSADHDTYVISNKLQERALGHLQSHHR